MTKSIEELSITELEKIRRLHLKSYLHLTYYLNFLRKGIDAPYVGEGEVEADYCDESPRAVLFRISGDIPPSLNAALDFGNPEDREVWLTLKTWWHGAMSRPFALTGGKFPYPSLKNPVIFVQISAGGKLYDLDNYGAKAVVDALDAVGVIQSDINLEWFSETRVKGPKEIKVIVSECNERLHSSLFDVYTLLSNRPFKPVRFEPASAKTGNTEDDFYSSSH